MRINIFKKLNVIFSAGGGRTGTFILIDICLRMAEQEKYVDVMKHMYEIRQQRPNLVDNAVSFQSFLKIVQLSNLQFSISCNFQTCKKVVSCKFENYATN